MVAHIKSLIDNLTFVLINRKNKLQIKRAKVKYIEIGNGF